MAKTMDPQMTRKIGAILERVKDPESGLGIERLGIIERVRYNGEKQQMYIFTNFLGHRPNCPSCSGIALALMASIQRDLAQEFKKEFPELDIEFV
jgi:metal-sulfur cluster biosynthetic enzyme